VLDATLRLTPLPKAKATALVLFDDLEKAGAGVVEILRLAPAAVELLDRTFVEVVRDADPGLASTLPSGTEAILIVELDGDDAKEVGDRPREAAAVARRRFAWRPRCGAAPGRRRPRRSGPSARRPLPILSRREGLQRNTRFIEDAAVHPEKMAEFVSRLRALLRRHELQAAISGMRRLQPALVIRS
jgi:FAD/FMN-containing dehydrogenase